MSYYTTDTAIASEGMSAHVYHKSRAPHYEACVRLLSVNLLRPATIVATANNIGPSTNGNGSHCLHITHGDERVGRVETTIFGSIEQLRNVVKTLSSAIDTFEEEHRSKEAIKYFWGDDTK